MSIKESALTAITAISNSDFVRAVTSVGASRRITVANLAKQIVEGYAGSSLAGSSQSVKSAIDSLNSKLSFSTLAKRVTIDANNNQGDSVSFLIFTGDTTRYKIAFGRNGNLMLQYFDGTSWTTIWTK